MRTKYELQVTIGAQVGNAMEVTLSDVKKWVDFTVQAYPNKKVIFEVKQVQEDESKPVKQNPSSK